MAYKQCCQDEANNLSASFCGTCRAPLLRCISFQECGQLVGPFKPCPVCLAPELVIETGAVVSAHVGDRLDIPLIIRNQIDSSRNQIPRPIRIQRVLKRERDRALTPVPLDWQSIDAGLEREFYLEAGPFDARGNEKIDVFLEVATRSKEGFEEAHVFQGSLNFPVVQDSSQQVVQNINLTGSHMETGALVHIPTNNSADGGTDKSGLTSKERRVVKLRQVESLEIELGTRAYRESGLQVSRGVNFKVTGFSKEDAPSWDVGLGAKGYLAFGRSGREYHSDENPMPMDVTLRCYNQQGELNVDASLLLSRHHFDLMVLNDRLMVFVRSAKGVLLNGKQLSANSITQVSDGDKIAPLADQPKLLALQIDFVKNLQGIDFINIRRLS